jgi:hypothetical protein
MTPAIRALLLAPQNNSAALFKKMARPDMPLPAFIEGWSVTDFNGGTGGTPPAVGAPLDSAGQSIVEYTVSGTAGDSALTISAGTASYGSGTWGGVIQHDDGTYGIYTISNLVAASCDIYPALRATCTGRTLRNNASPSDTTHKTEPFFKALARSIYARSKGNAYRLRYVSRWAAQSGASAEWSPTGGAIANNLTIFPTTVPVITGGALSGQWVGRGSRWMSVLVTSPYTGKGATKTFSIGGQAGFMEAFVACGSSAASPQFASFTVKLVIDDVTISEVTYAATTGLNRIIVPFSGGQSAVLTITRAAEEVGSFRIYVGDVTFWVYDRAETWTDPVIDKDAKTVVIGDSWTTEYSNAIGTELEVAMAASG